MQPTQKPQPIKKRPKIRLPRTTYAHMSGIAMGQGAAAQGTAEQEDRFTPLWTTLSEAITAIYARNAIGLSFEELYRTAYILVSRNQGPRLYAALKNALRDQMDLMLRSSLDPSFPITPATPSPDLLAWLHTLVRLWRQHSTSLRMVQDILMYLDRIYIPSIKTSPKPLSIWALGMSTFIHRLILAELPPVLPRTIDVVLELVRREREGIDPSHRDALASFTEMLSALHTPHPLPPSTLYLHAFVPPFLAASTDYYRALAATHTASSTVPEYLRYIQGVIAAEEDRGKGWLADDTRASLLAILEGECLGGDVGSGLIDSPSSGLAIMFDADDADSLSRMYALMKRVPKEHLKMREALKSRLTDLGYELNSSLGLATASPSTTTAPTTVATTATTTATAIQWIAQALLLKAKADALVRTAFSNDYAFKDAVSEAFIQFINAIPPASEYLSLYIDDHLKRGLKGKSDADVRDTLDAATALFRVLRHKDLFEAHYKAHLSRRLLHARSASDDAERAMIARLKLDCGQHFTQKMEAMFNDIKVSADLMSLWRQSEEQRKTTLETSPIPLPSLPLGSGQGPDLVVTVLTRTCWPIQPSGPQDEGWAGILWPQDLIHVRERFERFYLRKHTGRRLAWQAAMGTAEVKAVLGKGTGKKYDLSLSTLGMLVLLPFNEGDPSYSAEYLGSLTGIQGDDLTRTLQSLACGKHRILSKSPKGKDVAPSDTFSLNPSFSAPAIRLRIQQVAPRLETEAEARETRAHIDDSRRSQLDAAIVRLMKGRKKMSHNDLIIEVSSLLQERFPVDPIEIKRRIGVLIDREFLERSPSDRQLYLYVA